MTDFEKMRLRDAAEFGAAIRRERRARGLSQEAVALSAGVGLRFVHDLEHGKDTVELGRALRVAQAVGLRIEVEGSAPHA
ncbi:MAG TPA: helix-turn-helix domain-containing protein [Solirubrobacterales bacterium]|nr:helix-turn-helix domain-containing protein [Solirubrobacterales bacterium]